VSKISTIDLIDLIHMFGKVHNLNLVVDKLFCHGINCLECKITETCQVPSRSHHSLTEADIKEYKEAHPEDFI